MLSGIITYVILMLIIMIGVPVAIITLIVRHFTARRYSVDGTRLNTPINRLSPRKAATALMLLVAVYAGVAAVYVAPIWLLSMTDESLIFAFRLVAGLILLSIGIFLRRQRLLNGLFMTLGIIAILTSLPYVFTNLGSIGILIVIFLVLVALVAIAVRLSHKERQV